MPVPAVDQHGELDRAWPAEVGERIEGGPDGPAGEQHVVDQDHQLAVDAASRLHRAAERPAGLGVQIIAVQGDVEAAEADGDATEAGDALGQPVRQRLAAGGDAQQDDVGAAAGLFQDLVGDPVEHPGQIFGVQDGLDRRNGCCWDRLRRHAAKTPFLASLDESLKDVTNVTDGSSNQGVDALRA